MRARAILVLLTAMLGGCTTAQWDEMRANPREFFNIVSPTLVADAGVEGQTVALHRWQALVVRLDENPSTGERWQMQPIPSTTVITPVQHDHVSPAGPSAAPAGPGEAVFRLRGVSTGTQPVVLELKRPFESSVSKTIRFDVVVR